MRYDGLESRATPGRARRWWPLVGVTIIVCVAVGALVLWSLYYLPAPSPGAVIGTWSSQYLEGQIDLDLRSDGTYEERLSGFDSGIDSLQPRNHSGSWSLDGQYLVLVDILVVRAEPENNSFRWAYVIEQDWRLEPRRTLFGRKITAWEMSEVVWLHRVAKTNGDE